MRVSDVKAKGAEKQQQQFGTSKYLLGQILGTGMLQSPAACTRVLCQAEQMPIPWHRNRAMLLDGKAASAANLRELCFQRNKQPGHGHSKASVLAQQYLYSKTM